MDIDTPSSLLVTGTGSVGQAIAARAAELGHQVTIGTRDVAATRAGAYAAWAAEHPGAGLATLAEAAADAELVVNATSGTGSLAECIQREFPQAKVVKSLNTLAAELMVRPRQLADGDHSVFVSGDDAEAKRIVTGLLVSFGHTDVIDLGDLSTARGTEMLMPLWLRLCGRLDTALFNIKVVR
ncbi:NADPH-dependent F420 reductase [Micromonospora sp. NPDC049102]|uniref:NADPH-dependent F420 reductase n=1 Tax=Micromonospora sp. NPDC049102 TaxID=3364265 RepID=UPI003711C243